jgi:hypothetical protein
MDMYLLVVVNHAYRRTLLNFYTLQTLLYTHIGKLYSISNCNLGTTIPREQDLHHYGAYK